MTQTLIEQLEKLQLYWPGNRGEMYPAMTREGSRPRYVGANDLRAIIEDAKAEKQEPVSVLALKNTELSRRIDVLEDLLSSAYTIANRKGIDTHWFRFCSQLHVNGISPVTAKTFKILPSDPEYTAQQPDIVAELVKALNWAIENVDMKSVQMDSAKYDALNRARSTLVDARYKVKGVVG